MFEYVKERLTRLLQDIEPDQEYVMYNYLDMSMDEEDWTEFIEQERPTTQNVEFIKSRYCIENEPVDDRQAQLIELIMRDCEVGDYGDAKCETNRERATQVLIYAIFERRRLEKEVDIGKAV